MGNNGSLLGVGGGACINTPMCMEVGEHATSPNRWVGYDVREGSTPYGKQNPTHFLGLEIKLHNFDVSNGNCYIRFGEDEETQIPNVTTVVMQYGTNDGENYLHDAIYTWNSTAGRYEVVDQALCDYMLTQVGEIVGFKGAEPFIATVRMDIVGRISSFTRAGDFEMFSIAGGARLEYLTDFTRLDKNNILWTNADVELFHGGGNPNNDVVSANQSGYFTMAFNPNTIHRIDELTISGRSSADSTQFRFTFWDSNGVEILRTGLNVVTVKETVPIGIDISGA